MFSLGAPDFDNYQICSKLKTLAKVQIGKMSVCLFGNKKEKRYIYVSMTLNAWRR